MTSIQPIETSKIKAALFDLDGVITDSASLHAKAWQSMFDEFLYSYSGKHTFPYVPFSIEHDYVQHVDGKPRYEGVAAFLESRRIVLPNGKPTDLPTANTICGLGNRKNELVQEIIKQGVVIYHSTVEMITKLQSYDVTCAVVSSSRNAKAVLESVGLLDTFAYVLDGETAAAQGISGKPEPDTFLACAAKLGVSPNETIVIEDAISGVQAGSAGEFAMVIGVARDNNHDALLAHGATFAVQDLAEVLPFITK